MSVLRYAVVFGTSLVLMACCSCKKSKKDEILSSANNVAEAVRITITNWVATNGMNLQTNARISNALETFPGAFKTAMTNDVVTESVAAGSVLEQMFDQGLLPGVSKDDSGDMSLDPISSVVSNKAVAMVYPASRTFHLVKEGETSTNYYILTNTTVRFRTPANIDDLRCQVMGKMVGVE
jgi:hypothetical protein